MVARGHVWLPGGVCGCWVGAWLPGGVRGCWGVCMVARGACVVAGGVRA